MPVKKQHIDAGEVRHKLANINVPYTFDRNELVFHGTYAGTSYSHKEAAHLEGILYKAIEDSLNISWQPVIKVKQLTPDMRMSSNENFVGFNLERMWVARFPNGTYTSCQWSAQEQNMWLAAARSFTWEESLQGPFLVPVVYKRYNDTIYYLPYTEELWARVQALEATIKELRTQLLGMFEDVNVVELLLRAPSLLRLVEPKKERNIP